jgi:hypothetical protein
MDTFQARQGDVFIERIARVPKGAAPMARDAGRIILAYGEVTGHAHAIIDDGVELLSVGDRADRWLRVGAAGATVTHDEHAAIALGPGLYRIRIQREYSPEAIRNVLD